MNEPTQKPAAAQPIGILLQKRRQQLKLSLARVEVATKIRGKYLVWIESSAFAELPNDIYTRGFVSKYADFLGLDAAAVLAQYSIERGDRAETSVASPKPVRGRRLIVTPKIMIAGIVAVILGLTLAYLGWQFSALAAAPRLELNSPQDGLTIEGGIITVAGHVSEGADVLINDSPILTDANGNFSNKLALQEGVNGIKVTAKNKLGKTTTFTRNILAHLPLTSGQTTLPAASFDGVAASVAIKDVATNLIVQVDSEAPQTITMLPGTSRVFQAKSTLKITTSNSATTSLVITNTTVASKDLGVVGKGGELKLEFAKDTAFQ
jgi:hypothetical protein